MSTEKPNIVFVFSDQQRYDTMSCYGADHMNVPNLNKLSEESFVFKNAYVSQPVCTPARATLMTGLYPHTAGPTVNMISLPENTRVISEMISSPGRGPYSGSGPGGGSGCGCGGGREYGGWPGDRSHLDSSIPGSRL